MSRLNIAIAAAAAAAAATTTQLLHYNKHYEIHCGHIIYKCWLQYAPVIQDVYKQGYIMGLSMPHDPSQDPVPKVLQQI